MDTSCCHTVSFATKVSTSCSDIGPSSTSSPDSCKTDSPSTVWSKILSAKTYPLLPEVRTLVENMRSHIFKYEVSTE